MVRLIGLPLKTIAGVSPLTGPCYLHGPHLRQLGAEKHTSLYESKLLRTETQSVNRRRCTLKR